MRRLTLGEARSSIAEVLGVCTTDARIVTYLNEAQERLLNRDFDPVGSWVRYKVCAGASNCVVLPRQVRHVKAAWVCNEPKAVLSEWWEAAGYWHGGRGLMDGDGRNGTQLIDRGTACSFDNVIATTAEPRKIQAVAADSSDNGKTITLRYVDANGNRVYTSIGGTVQEGEQLTLSTSGVLTSSNVATNGLYHVVKATTNYPVRLYSYDVNSATQSTLLAVYEPSETVPIYRKYYVPGLTEEAACEGAESEDCTQNKAVTLAVRLQHIPVVVDNDPLVIGNLPALKDMVQSVLMKRRHEYEAAARLEADARRELDGELSSYFGDMQQPHVRMPDVETWGMGGVVNIV